MFLSIANKLHNNKLHAALNHYQTTKEDGHVSLYAL